MVGKQDRDSAIVVDAGQVGEAVMVKIRANDSIRTEEGTCVHGSESLANRGRDEKGESERRARSAVPKQSHGSPRCPAMGWLGGHRGCQRRKST